MATAMNVTIGPWVRDTPERLAADVLAEAHAQSVALLAETEALCEEWLAEADEEAQAILARADARAVAIVLAASAAVAPEPAPTTPPRPPLLSRMRRLLRRR